MIYEFECSKGHITEAMVPIGTKTWLCYACIAEQQAQLAAFDRRHASPPGAGIKITQPLAHRILSATSTNFVFADTGKRIKHVKEAAAKVREIKHS